MAPLVHRKTPLTRMWARPSDWSAPRLPPPRPGLDPARLDPAHLELARRGDRGYLNHSRKGGTVLGVTNLGLLRGHGLRVTGPRVAVLEAVALLPHSDTLGVLTEVRRTLPSVSVQAVYDILHALSDVGLVRRIEPAGHPVRYECRVGDNHHHVVCRRCGALDDVDCATSAAPCLEPVTALGFTIDEAEVTYWGLCPACQTTQLSPQRNTSDRRRPTP